ncbi:MAG: hypothetical protein LQ350_003294 [Teloschistes chrysophthalmus]|nr:MAG: hypothetical protein LQ350_003294 [Niorma chrysophthalma]
MVLPCGNPKYPLLHSRYHEGLYRDEGRRPAQDSAPLGFGLSNPPPEIWQALERVNAGRGLTFGYELVYGFIAAHGIDYVEPGPPPGLTIMDVAREETAERNEQERRDTEERNKQELSRLGDMSINDPSEEEEREWPQDKIVAMFIWETACLDTEDVDMARMNLDQDAAAAATTTTADHQGAADQAPPAATEDPDANQQFAAVEESHMTRSNSTARKSSGSSHPTWATR